MRHLWRDERMRQVLAACVTLGFATGVYAVSFGVSAVAAGASVWQTCAMSLLVFTGASQFSAVSVIGGGGTPVAAFSGAAVLAARNGVYGLAMSPYLGGSLPKRMVAAQLVIDESTAMSASQDDIEHRRAAFWVTGLSVYVFWNTGTLIGAVLGSVVDPEKFGLDVAFPAAFVAILFPMLRDRVPRRAAITGALVCLVLIPFTPVGVPILCATVGVLWGIPSPPPLEETA
ncbi:MAG: AzlC family ABC transporter permease [Ilumatobacteraceae bacterium]